MCRRQPGPTSEPCLVSGLGLAWHSALKNRHRRGPRLLASLPFHTTQICLGSQSPSPRCRPRPTSQPRVFAPGVPSDDMSHRLTVCSVEHSTRAHAISRMAMAAWGTLSDHRVVHTRRTATSFLPEAMEKVRDSCRSHRSGVGVGPPHQGSQVHRAGCGPQVGRFRRLKSPPSSPLPPLKQPPYSPTLSRTTQSYQMLKPHRIPPLVNGGVGRRIARPSRLRGRRRSPG